MNPILKLKQVLTTKRPHNPVKVALQELEYDFSSFELEGFIAHISQRRNKPIACEAWTLSPEIFGAWVPTEQRDLVIYNAGLQPVHQIHSILHELAHMVLKHPLIPLADVLPQLGFEPSGCNSGHVRMAGEPRVSHNSHEQEAEQFVYLIQEKVVKANRLAELTEISTSIQNLRRIADAAGYSG
jgi:hypothetical protein